MDVVTTMHLEKIVGRWGSSSPKMKVHRLHGKKIQSWRVAVPRGCMFMFFCWPANHWRLGRGADDRRNAKQYLARAQRAITLESAATAWAQGVPWTDALQIAERAIAKASPKPKPFPKRRARGWKHYFAINCGSCWTIGLEIFSYQIIMRNHFFCFQAWCFRNWIFVWTSTDFYPSIMPASRKLQGLKVQVQVEFNTFFWSLLLVRCAYSRQSAGNG